MTDTHPHTVRHADLDTVGHADLDAVSYADLDRLAPEVLPGRLLMSAAAPLGGGGDGHGGTTVVYSCQATYSPGTAGLLGTGLLAQPGYSSMTCIPSTIVQQY